MENTNEITENDYAPQIEIPDQSAEDQTITQAQFSQNTENETETEQNDQTEQAIPDEESSRELEKKWKDQKKRLAKIQREKHRIAAEADQLRMENENLKKYNYTSNQVSQTHYENSLKLKLEQAKENKRKAREFNDIDNELVADEELASVVADIRSMENWKAQQMIQNHEMEQRQNQYQTQNQNQYYDQSEDAYEENELLSRWNKQNSWFDPKSSNYDPEKADEVLTYAQALDANLAKQGREDEYLSKAYFDRINNYARIYDQQRNNSRHERISNIPNVAPVRRNSTQNQKGLNAIHLTDDEKFMARNAGISEDDWKKAKAADRVRQTEKMKFQNPVY